MSRPLRIEYAGAWYHVMNRGRRGENIFFEESDHELFLTLLRETSEMFDLRVSAYCLMPNHYHLLVQTPSANLSRAMRHINGVYTQRFNRANELDGQLFRGRYKSVLAEDDSHLLELLRYIHRNPVRAGLCNMVGDHRWSSHHGYISRRNNKYWRWLHKASLLVMFSENHGRAKSLYRTFIEDVDSPEILDFYDKKNLASFFGSSQFVQKMKERYRGKKEDPEIPQSRQFAPTVEEIKRLVQAAYDVGEDVLLKSVRGQVNEPRNVAIYLARKRGGLPLQEIGSLFSVEKYSSVSSIVCRTEKQMPQDRQLRRRIDVILSQIDKSQAKI